MASNLTNCRSSDYIFEDDAFFVDVCVIEVIEVISTTKVKVAVFPLYQSRIDMTMIEGNTYEFLQFTTPFRVESGPIFYSATMKAAKFTVCEFGAPSTPTLQISAIDAVLIPINNIPDHNRYGVGLAIRTQGTGKGNLKINWGTDYSETKTGLIAGFYEFKETLPPGAHNICADLFNVVL